MTSRNNYRLPPSHRLNLGVNFHKTTRNGNERIWNVSLYNAYNNLNPNVVYMTHKYDDNGNKRLIMEKMTVLPIMPSFSYTLKF